MELNNLLQGAIGSLAGSVVAVLGTFMVAKYTITRELRRERRLEQDRAGREAARRLLTTLSLSRQLIADAKTSEQINSRQREAYWLRRLSALEDKFSENLVSDTVQLPEELEKSFINVKSQLERVLVRDHLDEGDFVAAWLGNRDDMERLAEDVDELHDKLREYIRS